jgi:hypothetical protein
MSWMDCIAGRLHRWARASTSFTRPFEGTSTPLAVPSKRSTGAISPRRTEAIATGICSNQAITFELSPMMSWMDWIEWIVSLDDMLF